MHSPPRAPRHPAQRPEGTSPSPRRTSAERLPLLPGACRDTAERVRVRRLLSPRSDPDVRCANDARALRPSDRVLRCAGSWDAFPAPSTQEPAQRSIRTRPRSDRPSAECPLLLSWVLRESDPGPGAAPPVGRRPDPDSLETSSRCAGLSGRTSPPRALEKTAQRSIRTRPRSDWPSAERPLLLSTAPREQRPESGRGSSCRPPRTRNAGPTGRASFAQRTTYAGAWRTPRPKHHAPA